MFRQTLARCDIADGQLTVHQDRGAPMIAETYRDLLASFGAAAQPKTLSATPVWLPQEQRT